MAEPVKQREDWDDFCSPKARSIRALFEVALLWGIVWSVAISVGWVVSLILDQTVASTRSNWSGVLSILAGLATAIVIAASSDGPNGAARTRRFRRFVRVYGYPLILVAGVFVGWQWRDRRPPDPERESAIAAAAVVCGKIPLCVSEATRVNEGSDVSDYLAVAKHSR